jgi:polyphosphate kinase
VKFLHDEVLTVYLSEVVKARHMKADGSYDRPAGREDPRSMNSQEWAIKKIAGTSTGNGNLGK